MRRRRLLIVGGSTIVGTGCLGETNRSNNSSSSPSPTDTQSESPTEHDPAELLVGNFSPNSVTVLIVIRHRPSGDVLFSDEPTIPSKEESDEGGANIYSNSSASVSGGERRGGRYDLEITVQDGPAAIEKDVRDALDPGDHDGVAVDIYTDRIEFEYYE